MFNPLMPYMPICKNCPYVDNDEVHCSGYDKIIIFSELEGFKHICLGDGRLHLDPD